MAVPPHSRLAGFIEPLESRIAPAVTVGLALPGLNGSNGFKVLQEAGGSGFGGSASGAGDVNGDGFDDLIVGAVGAAYVLFGQAGGLPATFSVSSLDGSNGFKILGEAEGDLFGKAVSGAGDVNGDGFADLFIGASRAGSDGIRPGASYVIFGKAGGFAQTFSLSALNGSNGFKLVGETEGESFGYSVSSAGDVNGDGFADLIIGAFQSGSSGSASETSYVVFGKAGGFSPTFSLSTLDGSNGFKVPGQARRVSSAGDVNGDGFADLLIAGSSSSASVIFGHSGAFEPSVSLSGLNGINGFTLAGGGGGLSVSSAGDVNGDGFDDLLIGGVTNNLFVPNPTLAYVVFGHTGVFEPRLFLGNFNGSNGFTLIGTTGQSFSFSGYNVSAAGDVNGDGFADLLLGAFGSEAGSSLGRPYSRAGYVVFGKAGGFSGALSLSSLNGSNGFQLLGDAQNGRVGLNVSGAGDLNGDGFADLLLGALGRYGSSSGANYVVFGKSSFPTGISQDDRSVSFTDPDGDRVAITLSQGDIRFEGITLTFSGSGLLLSDLELRTPGSNRGATVNITAEGGQAEVGLVRVIGGAHVSELRVEGDVTALRVNGAYVPNPFDDVPPLPPPPPVGRVDLVHVGSLGVNQALFPGLEAKLDFQSRTEIIEIERDVSETVVQLQRGADRFSIGGDLLNSDLHTLKGLEILEVEGSVRNSVVSGLRRGGGNSAAAGIALKSITIGGDLDHSQLLAGFANQHTPSRGASIKSVLIEGNLLASDIVAGVTAGLDGLHGTRDDRAIADGDRYVSKIKRITVLGLASGSGDDTAVNGIVAEGIGAFSVDGSKFRLTPGAHNDLVPREVQAGGQLYVREVK